MGNQKKNILNHSGRRLRVLNLKPQRLQVG
jgi:hypothetical protein